MAQEITNTEYISLTYLTAFNTLDLFVNNSQSYSTSRLKAFDEFLKDTFTKVPKNFDYRSLTSMVILNDRFARLTSKEPRGKVGELPKQRSLPKEGLVRASKKIIYEYQIPYSQLNLVLLDAVILEMKNNREVA